MRHHYPEYANDLLNAECLRVFDKKEQEVAKNAQENQEHTESVEVVV